MSADQRIAAWIASLGTAQDERDAPALQPAHALLDDRSPVQLLQAAQALARLLRFYDRDDTVASGDWSSFMPAGDAAALQALVEHRDGLLPPHHALLLAFLELSRQAQNQLNGFTAQHLQHQYREVLGLRNRLPTADRAHLVLTLKKGAAPLELNTTHAFSAGKDRLKVDQRFAPVRPVVLGQARVQALSVVARAGGGLHFAPKADSADGLGAKPEPGAPQGWPPFTSAQRPAAPVGFALASPLLRLAEGQRSIAVQLGFAAGLQPRHQALASALQAYLSGPKGWLGPLDVRGDWSGEQCTLRLALPAAAAAVVDHDPAVHLQAFPAGAPVLQLLLKAGAALDFAALQPLRLRTVQLEVKAEGLRQLVLENDDGALDPKKAFLPFGSQPTRGSRLFIGCDEALGKRVTQLALHLRWQGAPANLGSWYAGYTRQSAVADGIRGTVSFTGAGGAGMSSAPLTVLPATGVAVHLDPAAAGTGTDLFSAGHGLYQLMASGNALTVALAQRHLLAVPHLRAGLLGRGPVPRAGFINVTLLEDLLHSDYPRDAVTRALGSVEPKALNPPYTPKAEQLTLDYTAQSDLSALDTVTAQAFQQTEVQLHQIDAFGSRREHAWLHSLRPWAGEAGAALLPQHMAAGELLVGLAPAQAGDAFSLLIQVAEGSADPEATPQSLQWSVLASDAWHPLGAAEGLLDTTQHLRKSGIVAGVLPAATTTDHTLMPAGRVWLRACIAAEPAAACRVLGVHANGVEVVFADLGNDPQRLAAPLPAGSIAKLATPVGAIKSVEQPYAGFGGALAEADPALARRAAERLRHRNRAISPWDIERLVLQTFPAVWRAKCIPHADGASWLAAGHFTVVVLPRLQGLQALDPLAPRVDLATLDDIRVHLQSCCAPQAQVHVRNPRYEPLQLQFKVRLRPGHGFGFYRNVLNEALLRQLSPWAFDVGTEPGFNGRVVRSALLDFVEAQPSVDFVTDFALFRAGKTQDLNEVAAQAPDAILVSAAQHLITELGA